jgi:cyclopropane fatty-acyl-phospholipid synthase-like methyltransferase
MEPKWKQVSSVLSTLFGNTGSAFFIVGRLQLDLLKQNGCKPHSQVLEIGCGCLVAGRPIMEYLLPGRYVGIEPNTWLINAAQEGLPDTSTLIATKRPVFLAREDFDASEVCRQFDFVISHSILSHAAHWQLPLFLGSTKRVLAPSGVAIVSLRFFDDDNRLMCDSNDGEWVYPGVSYFSLETIKKVSADCGLAVAWRKDYREFFVKEAPSNYHDWIQLKHA